MQLPGLKYLTLGTKTPDAQQAGGAGFTCRQRVCSQSRRFRFRPHVPAHAYMLRVEAVPPVGGGPHCTCFPSTKVSRYLNTDAAEVAVGGLDAACSQADSLCPCAPLRVYLTSGRPYPDGLPVAQALRYPSPPPPPFRA
jgi:hypothetical protein